MDSLSSLKGSHPQTGSTLENRGWSKGKLRCRGDADEGPDLCRELMGMAGLRPQGDIHVIPCGLRGKTCVSKDGNLRLRQLAVVSGGHV